MRNLLNNKDELLLFAKDILPFNRSLTGEGNRLTLNEIKKIVPELEIKEVPTGTECFDWRVPEEWEVSKAYIETPEGERICDFSENNLHLVGYSEPFEGEVELEELEKHLHTLPDMPNAIPYVTSYYERKWGFCLTHKQKKSLKKGKYRVCVDTRLFKGSMTYGEVVFKGKETSEIVLSTYICHPNMANNEISGPTVLTGLLCKLFTGDLDLTHSIRALFIPETIGSIYYLSRNLEQLQKNTIAGLNFTCVGDQRNFTFLPSRLGNTYADRLGRHIIKNVSDDFIEYPWNERGSDERQFCAPNVNLPFISLMRTKHTEYPEYHTSLDKIGTVVTADGLWGGLELNYKAIEALNMNCVPKSVHYCEPFMSKYDLYPKTNSGKRRPKSTRLLMNILTWSDGNHDLLEIAEKINVPIWELYKPIETLKEKGLINCTSVSNALFE